jgi:penicillin amidase
MQGHNDGVMKILRRVLGLLLVMALVGGLGTAGWVRTRLHNSLPQLEGQAAVDGLGNPVTVTRDARGIPFIRGSSRADVARALGFVHAHDRFFQMDLQRRQPAGELSALVGPAAVAADERMRAHRFRHVAREALQRAEPAWRDLLVAYTEGVNAGLAALGAPSFEYALLRQAPERWTPEDSILAVMAMFSALQGRQMEFEQAAEQVRSAVPPEVFEFLTRAGSEWDAPAEGEAIARPPVPGPGSFNPRSALTASRIPPSDPSADPDAIAHAAIGSNNWAVDAAHTGGHGALLANDMHLQLGVPNIWYRAAMQFPDPDMPGTTRTLHGVTLPGLPVQVVGSNGDVAWGFTNTGGDWSDLVRIEPDPASPDRYLTPDGPRSFETITEQITVSGEAARPLPIRTTIWGPIVWTDVEGHAYAQHWVAHDPDVIAGDLSRPERAHTIDELMTAVVGLGVPHQNVAMAGRDGRIAWTVGGAIPVRRGFSGATPVSWADGSAGWDGYVTAAAVPRIVDPEVGRVWTANAPVVDGARLATIGDGGYADGIRARIIRDDLLARTSASPRDMLSLQLNDRALFLERWRTLVLRTLESATASAPAARADGRRQMRDLIERTWTGRASVDSTGYRLVRMIRTDIVRRVLTFVTAPAKQKDPSFDYTQLGRTEGPVWAIVDARPVHLLDARYDSWDALFLDAIDAVYTELTADGRPLSGQTWGDANRAQIVHPLTAALPVLGRWLNMPGDPLPGDAYTPRAQSPRTGASERLVVSPGREAEGLLQMPTGQSSHPLSPFFGTMHREWVEGTPSPLVPGPVKHTLTLVP